MNKTLKLFSLVAGFATFGSQFDVCASEIAPIDNEEIVRYRTSLEGADEQFPVEAMTGFSGTEATHTWSLDDKASLSFPRFRDGKDLIEVSLPNTAALVTPHHPQQTIRVGFVGHLEDYEFTTANQHQTIVVQLPKNLTDDNAVLEFYTPNSCLVSVAIPEAQDARKLGISVNSILLTYAKDESKRSAPKKALTPRPLKNLQQKPPTNSGGMGDLAQQLASATLKKVTLPTQKDSPTTTSADFGDLATQALSVKLRKTPTKQTAEASTSQPTLAVVLRPTSPKITSTNATTESTSIFPKLKPTGIKLTDDTTDK